MFHMQIKDSLDVLGEHITKNSPMITKVLDYLDISPNDSILDIGTGNGIMAIHLAAFGLDVLTGEPKGDNWADWETSAKKAGVREKITFRHFRGERMPFNDSSFNFVFIYGSFHHFKKKYEVLKDVFRVLKPKGKLVIFEFTKKGISQIKRKTSNHPDFVDPCKYFGDIEFALEKTIKNERFNIFILKKE